MMPTTNHSENKAITYVCLRTTTGKPALVANVDKPKEFGGARRFVWKLGGRDS